MQSAESIIQHYNRLNGTQMNPQTLRAFHAKLQRFLDGDGHGPGSIEVRGIFQRVTKVLKGELPNPFQIELTPIDISKLKSSKPAKQKVFKHKSRGNKKKQARSSFEKIDPTIQKKAVSSYKEPRMKKHKGLEAIRKRISPKVKRQVDAIAKSISGVNYQYKEIALGDYAQDFHRMYSDTIVQIHGLPGHGKTVYLLKLAQYLASNQNVLYVAREEYGRSTFDMKLKEHHIGHKNLHFTRALTDADLKWCDVVFLDSVTALKLTHEDIEELSIQYPNKVWFLVLQSTKGGDFRGSNEWEHLVDIAGEIHNRKLILRKNRLDPENSKKAEKLRTEDAILEAKKKLQIRETVKKSIQPKKAVESNHVQLITV